jgi:hypothetical protein
VSCCGRGAKAPEQIEERKLYLGSRGFAGQYDQEPVPLGGARWTSAADCSAAK